MLEQLYQRQGSAIFLKSQGKTYSYQWLQDKLKKISGLMESLQLKSGDKILLSVSAKVNLLLFF